jgi:integrase
MVALRRGEVAMNRATTTVESAVLEWLDAAEDGKVRTRGRKPFAPTTIRSVRQNYRRRVHERFGRRRLDQVTLLDIQEWVDELDCEGVNPGTIETSVLPLRLVYRHAKTRGRIAVDPTDGLELPEKQETDSRRPPSPDQVGALLDAVNENDRAAWATLILSGLRRGELMALDWDRLDLDGGTLRVERSYIPGSGYRRPKSRKGIRTVPVGPTLARFLKEHRLRSGRREGLVFGYRKNRPLDVGKLQERADDAWSKAGLDRVTPHVCRHWYASIMAAAGVSLHALSTYMGHSSIAVTWDRYGHLFPGEEAQAATLQEAFLAHGLARTAENPR